MLLLCTALLFANKELSLDEDFLKSIEEVSQIATKTKLNIDDSPSFITVLHPDKLQKLGIDNVFEALAQVPGVQLKREASGVPVVVFRGVSQKGEVKLMIDGVTINNSYRGSIYYYLNFPIELVQRIEIIRGAGSVLYGSGAISGVVNIITKSASNDRRDVLFLSGGTYDNYKSGAIVFADIGEIKLALDAYYQDDHKSINLTDRHLNDYSTGIKLNNKYFTLFARIKKSEQGNAYGILGNPDIKKEKYYNQNNSIFTQLAFNHSLGDKSKLEAVVGFNRYSQDIETSLSATLPVVNLYKEESYYMEANVHSTLIALNKLLVGVRAEKSKAKRSEFKIAGTPHSPIANPNSLRETLSAYINDTYSFSSALDISAGFRFDDYSDFGDAASPTVGVVYRLNDNFRLKALYAQAYRAPSWIELTSNPRLQAETSNSLETGIIYKNHTSSTLRLNLYKTKINNLITKNMLGKYVQSAYANFLGTELEYTFTPTDNAELDFFASDVQAKDQNDIALADIANFLATASVLYDFDFGLTVGSLVKYVSSSKRAATDTRANAPSSTLFDQTFSYQLKDITASFVIKDLFNKGTYYALPSSTKYDDFYNGGRSFLLKAEWKF